MYSTCLFCNSPLGTNEVIEHFPVGRRLAFDAAKGRLWVVCRKCERWNLTPLEERWEAIEEAERQFAETRLRVSTDNIGLARLREGLELVRIGAALRPEMAAWRYGDQFGRRRRRRMAFAGAATAMATGLVIAGPVTGIIAGGGWFTWQLASNAYGLYQNRRVRARLSIPGLDSPAALRKGDLDHVALVKMQDDWGLSVPLTEDVPHPRATRHKDRILSGTDARLAAGRLLPAINETGGSKSQVQSAVQLVTDAESPDRLFRQFARLDERELKRDPRHAMINQLPHEARLALEMASHEDQERRAMEGELALLAAAWRDAEEIARIADDMFLPESATRLDDFRREG